ncbi:MAG: amidohydrolase [bacterium]
MRLIAGRRASLALALLYGARLGAQSGAAINAEVQAIYPRAEALYLDLHRHPELSFHETETAAKIAGELRQLGYDVTTGVGKTGVVAVLKNGAGPTVMLRTELDALPVVENTGLPFASTVRTKDDAGFDVGVMHACGHDVHMAALVASARIMAGSTASWRGTLVLIGQPAEETLAGAKAMIADGLLTRFPRPDYVIAVHDDSRYAAGMIGFHAGPILTNNDGLTVHIYGRGGHGARPETTIDPIVIAARTVLTLQTIVSREISPFDAAVVTVGSIHGGTKHNIIPDEVTLQLTVRSFTDPVRRQLLASIERIIKAEATAGGATREPSIEHLQPINALVNDSALTRRVSAALLRGLGTDRVRDTPAEMASEDLAEFPGANIPTVQLRVGAAPAAAVDAAARGGPALPSLHNSKFYPDREPTIKAAIAAEVLALRELMPAVRR